MQKSKTVMENLIDYIGLFFIFDGIIIGAITLINLIGTPVPSWLLPSVPGYFPSNIYVTILNLVIAGASFFVGMGLMAHQHWARIGAVLLAVPMLIDLYWGTLFGLIIMAIMVAPYANALFGAFKPKAIPFRIAGVLVVVIAFFSFSFLSGMSTEFVDTLNYELNGFPQANGNPAWKIQYENYYGDNQDVIVELTAPLQYAVQQQNEFLQSVTLQGGQVIRSYHKVFNGMHIRIDGGTTLEGLASSSNVKAIYKNNYHYLYDGEYLDGVTGLSDSNRLLDTDWLWNNGYDGTDVTVAIIDTGINPNMEWFQRDGQSIVVAEYERYGDWVYSHGTACASCVASQHSTYRGVAPMANLIDVEIFFEYWDEEDECYRYTTLDSDIIWGYEKVAEYKEAHPDEFVIASCSFGIPAEIVGDTWAHPYPPSRSANNLALDYGVPVICASGNDAPVWQVSAPASAQFTLGVGAVDKDKDYASFSSRGPTPDGHRKPDVCNVGVDVFVFNENGGVLVASGTSFATPLTAGIMACVATPAENRDYSAVEYYNAFRKSADDVGSRGFDYKTGYGFVDGEGATKIIGRITPIEVYSMIAFAGIFAGIGIVFYPEWGGYGLSSGILKRKRKWIKM